jgi:hypothetical protein
MYVQVYVSVSHIYLTVRLFIFNSCSLKMGHCLIFLNEEKCVKYLETCMSIMCWYIFNVIITGFSLLLPSNSQAIYTVLYFWLLNYSQWLCLWGTFHDNIHQTWFCTLVFVPIQPDRMMLQAEHWLWKYHHTESMYHICKCLGMPQLTNTSYLVNAQWSTVQRTNLRYDTQY